MVIANETKTQGAYASGVNFRFFGTTNISLDVVPARRPGLDKDGKFGQACPHQDHVEPCGVSTRYTCNDNPDHGVFTQSELLRFRDTDKGPVWVSGEEIKAVRTGGKEPNEMIVEAHPVEDVLRDTRPDGSLYRLRPGKKATSSQRGDIAALTLLASDPAIALVGRLRLRDTVTLYRMETWHGQLVLTGLVHPADLALVDSLEVSPEIAAQAKLNAVQIKNALEVKPFNADEYLLDVAAATEKLLADPERDTARPDIALPGEEATMFNFVEAALAAKAATEPKAKKPRKAAAKRAPAKKKVTKADVGVAS